MKKVRVVAVSLNQIPLDWEGNYQRCLQGIALAKGNEATIPHIICLPEMAITGYGVEDHFGSDDVITRAWASALRLAQATMDFECLVAVGLPVMFRGAVWNGVALCAGGKIVAIRCKMDLAGDGNHYEPRWFRPWPRGVVESYTDKGNPTPIPIGDVVLSWNDVTIGLEVCEEAWVGNRPGADLAKLAVDVILNPSASHFSFGKQDTRRRFVTEGSRAFSCAYAFANLLGNESGRVIYDGGPMVAAGGTLLAEAPRFQFGLVQAAAQVIDVTSLRMNRARTQSFHPDLTGHGCRVINVPSPFVLQAHRITLLPSLPIGTKLAWETPFRPSWADSSTAKFEEFTRVVCLGLWDYMRKSRSAGFVVSLSGGCDSAACVTLIHQMCKFAFEDLPRREVGLTLQSCGVAITEADFGTLTVYKMTRLLLATAYQGTENSGEITRNAAAGVADAVNAEHHDVDVGPLFVAYREMTEKMLGRVLDWANYDDDIVLQNLQARARGPGIWALANARKALLVTTSNRSEASVGYATMDGDTCGGLAPLGGIDKAFLREWLDWMRTSGPDGCMAIPELELITKQQPTAELRPAGSAQTDETDLMPYPILGRIERLLVRDKACPVDIYDVLVAEGNASADAIRWIKKYFQLWTRNQWKRERFAPSFHLDDENVDPKTGCRFPILSAGFASEIRDLEIHALVCEGRA